MAMLTWLDGLQLFAIDHKSGKVVDYYDDMSGQVLPDELVCEARAEEIKEVDTMCVWRKVARNVCIRETGRPPIGSGCMGMTSPADG